MGNGSGITDRMGTCVVNSDSLLDTVSTTAERTVAPRLNETHSSGRCKIGERCQLPVCQVVEHPHIRWRLIRSIIDHVVADVTGIRLLLLLMMMMFAVSWHTWHCTIRNTCCCCMIMLCVSTLVSIRPSTEWRSLVNAVKTYCLT